MTTINSRTEVNNGVIVDKTLNTTKNNKLNLTRSLRKSRAAVFKS